MSTVVYQYAQLTLTELAKTEHNGQLLRPAMILAQDNEILFDAVWQPSNNKYSHITAQQYREPSGSWRTFNAGVATEEATFRNVVDTIGMLEGRSEKDKRLVDTAADPAGQRNIRNAAFLQGMGKTLAYTMIYGNAATDPKKFTGLAPRMASLNSYNVLGCSGTGSDLTSMYLVQWGPGRVFMVYPEGTSLGISHRDLGEETCLDSDSYKFQAYVDLFQVDAGLVVEDPKCIARVCNVETSGSSNLFDVDKLVQVLNNMRNQGRGAVLYVNPTLKTQIDIAAKDKGNVWYQAEDWAGRPVTMIRGCPVRTVEAIVNSEDALT